MSKFKDITGQRFGKLTAVEKVGRTKNYETIWKTVCDCGQCAEVTVCRLMSGVTKSCGCLVSESVIARSTTHGMSKSPEFASWCSMKQRCTDTNDAHKLKYYGDVEIQDNWMISFSDFLSHIGKQPVDGKKYSLERIKNDIGYVEGNVRWATTYEQARNKTLQEKSVTGVNGVTLAKKNRRGWEELRYIATVHGLDGKKISKTFSVFKYGLLPAFKMAVMARKKMIEDLNFQGAGYSENHGK